MLTTVNDYDFTWYTKQLSKTHPIEDAPLTAL